jgi:hypothetical protein
VSSLAVTFARFVGLAVLIFGAVMFFGNLIGAIGGASYQPSWALYLVLGFGLTGIGGAIVYLLSFDGPAIWRTRGRRLLGWFGMMICAAVPSGLLYLIAPLVLVSVLTVLLDPAPSGRRRGRHLVTSG